MAIVYALLWCLSAGWLLLGAIAVRRTVRRSVPPRALGSLPPVSVLKPLSGTDPDLERNLRSFFEQSYPGFELLFGIEATGSPEEALVRRLALAYPTVPCRVVTHAGDRGANPKVRNLRALAERAAHDVLVISDSNVAADPEYLRSLATDFMRPETGLVTSLVTGESAGSVGAAMEALYLNGPMAGAVALSHEFLRHPVAIGKSMMFRRATFERLGGFESISDMLAEDYVLGRMFHEAGYRVRLARVPALNVIGPGSVRAFARRVARWSLVRARLNPLAYALELVTMPLVLGLIAPLFGAPFLAGLALALASNLRDVYQARHLGQSVSSTLRALAWSGLRDVIVLGAWAYGLFARRVRWRGHSIRVTAGTRLYRSRKAPCLETPGLTPRAGS